MTLFRGNDDNALALLAKPAAEALERNGLACTCLLYTSDAADE